MLAPATPDELAALFLRGRDVPCRGCGYNRRDGTGAACPECRAEIQVLSIGPDLWMSLNRGRSMVVAWGLLLLCIAYWLAFCIGAWEMVQIISVDLRPWTQWWWILHLVLYIPVLVCLPLAAWHFARFIRYRVNADLCTPYEPGMLFYSGFRWSIIAIAPWTLFSISLAVWETLP